MNRPVPIVLLLVALAACTPSRPPVTPQGPASTGPQPSQAAQAAANKDKTDDWEYVKRPVMRETVGAAGAVPPPPSPAMASRLGLSTGGAKDAGNFRENLKAGFLPLPTDIAYEGLFYDYFFDTGAAGACQRLFCPSYTAAVSPDPFSRRDDLFLTVGLNSGLDAARFSRKRLNLVVVLDISGSMGSPFDEYYYDRFGNKVEAPRDEANASKLQIATRSIVSLLSHLRDEDRLGIVLFDTEAYRAKRVRELGLSDRNKLDAHILDLEPGESTDMEAGMRMAIEMLAPFRGADRGEYENRVIFLTDAMPNTGETSEDSLLGITKAAAANGVYATFIGIGVDFNTELVSGISRVRGANYYAVHSARDFAKRLDDEFEFMVTPLVFDLRLQLDASGYEIVGVYGSPEANEATGEIMKVNTLFPSKVEGGETRGGVILLHLRAVTPGGRLALTASYEDRQGRRESDTATVSLPRTRAAYPNTGIRKAILLARYGNLLRTWLADERAGRDEHHPAIVSITEADGIPCPRPAVLGRWERQSLPLAVSGGYKPVLSRFLAHFRDEARAVNDPSLDKEVKVLELLVNK